MRNDKNCSLLFSFQYTMFPDSIANGIIIVLLIILVLIAARSMLLEHGRDDDHAPARDKEHLEEPVRLDNKAIDMAPREIPTEVDTIDQRITDIIYPNDTMDNSDVVQGYLQKGSSIFQPGTAQGVTTTSSANHSNFTLAQPGMYNQYSVPLNPRGYNADEALARKQQHRGNMNKRAIDGMVRSTRNVFQKYFTDELRENENREWWSAEAQPIETDFRPYY
jgi:hypothetical protein